jgi:hypothetical protein
MGGLRVLLVIGIFALLAMTAPAVYELANGPLGEEDFDALAPLAVSLLGLAGFVVWIIVLLLSIIYTTRLTFRMMKNLDAFEAPINHMSPTMAVVWYFIPIASLLMPYRAFKQIWKGTFEVSNDPEPSDGAVGPLWLTWILFNITSGLETRMTIAAGGMDEFGPTDERLYMMSLWVGVAATVFGVLACWFMIKAFGPVSRAQDAIIAARTPA